jgi:hypothetical protein
MENELQQRQVRRILNRYLVEVVEYFGLCPWARAARENAEIAIEVVIGGTPTKRRGQYGDDGLAAALEQRVLVAAAQLIALPTTKLAIVVVVDPQCDRIALRELRTKATAAIPSAGVADFHPDAEADFATPARLVSFLRRAPDPFLQLVPFAILDAVRGGVQTVDRAAQLALLATKGAGSPVALPREDIGDVIAARNHARLAPDRGAEMLAVLEDIENDRERSYQTVGLLA